MSKANRVPRGGPAKVESMFIAPPIPIRIARTLAWLIVALGLGSTPVLAELAKPTNPLCKDCEGVCAAYSTAWPAFQAKLKEQTARGQALDAAYKAAEAEKARAGKDKAREEHWAKDMARIDRERYANGDAIRDAYSGMEARQSTIAACIKNQCFMGAEGPAPRSAAGEAEKCKACKPLADRVALLDQRIGELVKADGVIRAAEQTAFAKSQLDALDDRLLALQAARGRAQKELEACRERTKERCEPEKKDEPAPAAAVDRCVVGEWKSEPVSVGGGKPKGGDGVIMTIKADGTLTIDYSKMTAVPASSVGVGSNLWEGTATGRIETRDGKARVESVEKSAITVKFTDPQGKVHPRSVSGLGSFALGNNVMGSFIYRCNDTTLSYDNPPHKFTFKRVR